jgi:hypothetical protein
MDEQPKKSKGFLALKKEVEREVKNHCTLLFNWPTALLVPIGLLNFLLIFHPDATNQKHQRDTIGNAPRSFLDSPSLSLLPYRCHIEGLQDVFDNSHEVLVSSILLAQSTGRMGTRRIGVMKQFIEALNVSLLQSRCQH